MNSKGRIENSIKNSIFGVLTQTTNILLGLIVRTFFIKCLNSEYLGVNGLFTNILTILSLAELGVGGAIVYNLYKPIAENDYIQISKLMNLYRKAYIVIGIAVGIIGSCIIPFLDYIIKDKPDIDNLILIYALFLLNTVFSYFFAYKRSIFSADQKERVLQFFKLLFYVIRSVVQIVILLLTHNFILYLIIQIVCTCLENISISVYADKKYPFMREYRNEQLNNSEKKSIFDNVKALSIYKIGSTVLDGTDNIIISAFDGVISVGLLSNYTLITGSVQMLLSQVSNAITGSVGNFIAKEKSDRHEEMLIKMNFVNFVIYGLVFVMLMAVINPFISLWVGSDYLLGYFVVFVICLNLYISGMMGAIWTFRSTMGLFIYGKWRPIISAIINVVVSIVLAKYIGLLGVLLGTTITRITTNVWYDPYIVYKHGLKKSPVIFYLKWFSYLSIVLGDVFIMYIITMFEGENQLLNFVINAIFGLAIFICSVIIFFNKTDEYQYLLFLVKNTISKFYKKHL